MDLYFERFHREKCGWGKDTVKGIDFIFSVIQVKEQVSNNQIKTRAVAGIVFSVGHDLV